MTGGFKVRQAVRHTTVFETPIASSAAAGAVDERASTMPDREGLDADGPIHVAVRGAERGAEGPDHPDRGGGAHVGRRDLGAGSRGSIGPGALPTGCHGARPAWCRQGDIRSGCG
eukprot:scaffold27701_cov101-Isochrysis_galbana.AAC.1